MQGEIGFFALGLAALVIWSPAFAAAVFVASAVNSRLRARGIGDSPSRASAALASIFVLFTYLPVYLYLIFSLFDWGIFPSGAE
jgi:hypothetical protein